MRQLVTSHPVEGESINACIRLDPPFYTAQESSQGMALPTANTGLLTPVSIV